MSNPHTFAVGQVWTYQTRPGDEGSTVQINRIETVARLGVVFHLSVHDVHLRSDEAPEGFVVTDLPHFPAAQESLETSVIALSERRARTIDFESGYSEWREAFDAGRAGVFTIPVAEIVAAIEQAIAGPSH